MAARLEEYQRRQVADTLSVKKAIDETMQKLESPNLYTRREPQSFLPERRHGGVSSARLPCP
jgi:hypothetical protein